MKRILKAVLSCTLAVGVIALGASVPGCQSPSSTSSKPADVNYKCAKPG